MMVLGRNCDLIGYTVGFFLKKKKKLWYNWLQLHFGQKLICLVKFRPKWRSVWLQWNKGRNLWLVTVTFGAETMIWLVMFWADINVIWMVPEVLGQKLLALVMVIFWTENDLIGDIFFRNSNLIGYRDFSFFFFYFAETVIWLVRVVFWAGTDLVGDMLGKTVVLVVTEAFLQKMGPARWHYQQKLWSDCIHWHFGTTTDTNNLIAKGALEQNPWSDWLEWHFEWKLWSDWLLWK